METKHIGEKRRKTEHISVNNGPTWCRSDGLEYTKKKTFSRYCPFNIILQQDIWAFFCLYISVLYQNSSEGFVGSVTNNGGKNGGGGGGGIMSEQDKRTY